MSYLMCLFCVNRVNDKGDESVYERSGVFRKGGGVNIG